MLLILSIQIYDLVIFHPKKYIFAFVLLVLLCFHVIFLCSHFINKYFLQVTEDFMPIISRIKATTAPLGGPKGEILYAREHEAVWFKGKRFAPAVWAGTPGEEQIKQLKPALDSKGRKVGEEWFTTMKVEDALTRCANFLMRKINASSI